MTLEKRLRASVKMDAHNGDSNERWVCGKQMVEAAAKIEQLQRERDEAISLLREVTALAVGESPAHMDEDRRGDGKTATAMAALIARIEGEKEQ